MRGAAGVFDVSHMGRFEVPGRRAHAGLQGLLSNDLDALAPGEAQYTLLTNEAGGITDDLIVYRLRRRLPAGRERREPRRRPRAARRGAARVRRDSRRERRHRDARAAGPDVARAAGGPVERGVRRRAGARVHLGQRSRWPASSARSRARATRASSGVELICPAADAVRLWDALTAAGAMPCGLGARDTLRLEVCYPLHGNDIGPDTNAIEAGLGWVCARERDVHRVGRAAPHARDRAGAAPRRVPHARARDPARGLRDPRSPSGAVDRPA